MDPANGRRGGIPVFALAGAAISSSQCLSWLCPPWGARQAELRGWSTSDVLHQEDVLVSASPGKKGFSTESLAASSFYDLREGEVEKRRSPCSGRTRAMLAQLPHVCFSEGVADRQQHK